MTEQNLTDGGTQNTGPAPVVTPSSTPASNEQTQERMLRQSEVNELIKGAKLDAEKRVRAEFEAQRQQSNSSQSQPTPQVSGNTTMSPEDFKRIAREEFQQQQNYFASQQMVHQFINKMEAGKQKYPDFETKVAQLQIDKIPQLIPLLSQADNAADIMYDLADPANAHKISAIMANLRDPNTAHLANMQMQALSQSIKANEAAKKQPNVEEPLSQLSHSTTTMDSGNLSISDKRKNPKYRV